MKDKIAAMIMIFLAESKTNDMGVLADSILALFKAQEDEIANNGARMMASQIRKAIETGSGDFANELIDGKEVQSDANWILQRFKNPPSLDWIEVVEKCRDYTKACPSNCHDCPNLCGRVPDWECATEGTITRPATKEDFDNLKRGEILCIKKI